MTRARPDFPDRPFVRSDLPTLGISDAALARGIECGEVRRLLRGVFVSARVPDSYDLRIAAVQRSVAPGHIACDRTAGWVHGIDLLGPSDSEWLPPVEVCRTRWQHPTDRSDIRGRTRDLTPEDIMVVEGLLVTTPLRTALDLGCVLRRRDALAALDQFRRRFGISATTLARESARYFRRRGVIQLRELIPLSDPTSESVRESWTRIAIIDAGLPVPVLQYEIEVDRQLRFRLDLAYPGAKVAIEYDGEEFHHTAEQQAHDQRRREWLRSNGWRVIVVRRGDFTGRRLDEWLGELRRALGPSYSNLRW